MKRDILAKCQLSIVFIFTLCLFAGCPPPCEIPNRIDVPNNDPELIGYWEGEVRAVNGLIAPVTMNFTDETFRLDVTTADGVLYVEGRWGTSIHDESWKRLDLNVGCSNFQLSGTGYEVWQYQVVSGVLLFASRADFNNGEGDPGQDGPFYELNHIP